MRNWIRTSKRQRCPICDRPDWCSISDDGAVVHCMRDASEWACISGGWFHRMDAPRAPTPKREWVEPATTFAATPLIERWMASTPTDAYERLASNLGVTADSLRRMSAAWAGEHGAWAFPMTGATNTWCGIRLRDEAGAKWAVRGTRTGLFIPHDLTAETPLFLVEGPTEVAAMLTWGLDAVGRPSCSDGDVLVKKLVDKWPTDVIVVADLDAPKHRPDGTIFYPGQDGAIKLANYIRSHRRKLVVICPPDGLKDCRQWLNAGGSRRNVMDMVQSKRDWRIAK